MPTLQEFRHFIESEMLGVHGSSLDRLKFVLNHFNIARLDLSPNRRLDVVLSFFFLGKTKETIFDFGGQVVLPWCRRLGDLPPSAYSPSEHFIFVKMLDAENAVWGEGQSALYRGIENWWKGLKLRQPGSNKSQAAPILPWPGADTPKKASKEALSGLWLIIKKPNLKEDYSLPERVSSGQVVLFVPVHPHLTQEQCVLFVFVLKSWEDSKEGGISMIEAGQELAECTSFLVRHAFKVPAYSPAHSPQNLLEKGLQQMWQELQAFASSSNDRPLEPDELLILFRHIPPDASSDIRQQVRFVTFPEQRDRMTQSLLAHIKRVGPIEHFLRCAVFLASRRQSPEDLQALARALDYFVEIIYPDEEAQRDKVLRVVNMAFWENTKFGNFGWADVWNPGGRRLIPETTDIYALSLDRLEQICKKTCEILTKVPFPLNLAISNSAMDSNSLEIIRGWASDKRVDQAKLNYSDPKEPLPEKAGYPAILLLAEVSLFNSEFFKGVLFVPLVSPAGPLFTGGECPAFGLVYVLVDKVDATRAAQIIRTHAGILHDTILLTLHKEVQNVLGLEGGSEPRMGRETMAMLIEIVRRGMTSVLTLSGRVRHVASLPSSQIKSLGSSYSHAYFMGGHPKQSLVVSWDETAIPGDLHRTYTDLLAALTGSVLLQAELNIWSQVSPWLRHDLWNILIRMSASAESIEIAAEGTPFYQKANQLCGYIKEATDLLERLVPDNIEKLFNPQLNWHPIHDVISIINQEAQALNIVLKLNCTKFSYDLTMQGGFVRIDAGLLKRVIRNLLENSRDAVNFDDNLKIILKLYYQPVYHKENDRPKKLVFEVTDNGPGFHPDIIAASKRSGMISMSKKDHYGWGHFALKSFAANCGAELELFNREGAVIRLIFPLREEAPNDGI